VVGAAAASRAKAAVRTLVVSVVVGPQSPVNPRSHSNPRSRSSHCPQDSKGRERGLVRLISFLVICWIVHNWPFRHCPRHLSRRQAPLISLTPPASKNAVTPTTSSRRHPQTSPYNTTLDDCPPCAPPYHAVDSLRTTRHRHDVGLYDVGRRSRPHRPALHADHCCASLPLSYTNSTSLRKPLPSS
jgi:hypothetical protein